MRLYTDIETRGTLDLKLHGAPRCAAGEHAGINVVGFAENSGKVRQAKWHDCLNVKSKSTYSGMLAELYDAWCRADYIVAHNAPYEMVYFKTVFGWEKPANQWICTMAKAGYYGYPRGLDDAAKALGCSVLKDIQGKGVMMKLINPIYTPEDCPEDFERLYQYNIPDILAMREVDQKLPDLPPEVQENWALDAEINMRGIPIDLKMVANAINLRAQFAVHADAEMQQLTSGCVQTVGQVGKLQDWMSKRNVHMVDMTADTVEKTLQVQTLLPVERRALELRQESGLSSLAKYEKMRDYQVDGLLHQMHDWYGAHTGRPTGNGPQMLNLPRGEDPPFWAETISKAPAFIHLVEQPLEKLKEAQRGTFCAPPGKRLVGMDQSQGEARATFWIADDPGLSLFTTSDPYCTYGTDMFGYAITKKDDPEKRQAAKATVLAFDFAGGIGAGQRIATNNKIDFKILADVVMPRATQAEIMEGTRLYDYYLSGNPLKPLNEREGVAVDILKQWFRRDFPRVVAYWDELEYAFLNGGVAGRVTVYVAPDNTRVLTLPSGRSLYYRDVKVHGRDGYSYQARYKREHIWKGVLIENVAQAISTDINNWYKVRVNKFLPIIHHCYDEMTGIIAEAEAAWAMYQLKELTQNEKPEWCDGLPLGFDYWTGVRYGK